MKASIALFLMICALTSSAWWYGQAEEYRREAQRLARELREARRELNGFSSRAELSDLIGDSSRQ